LVVLEIESQRFYTRSIPGSRRDPFRERPGVLNSAMRTDLTQGVMFCRYKSQRRQVQHLTTFPFCARYLRKRVSATPAGLRGVDDYLRRGIGKRERFTGMSLLTAGFASAGFSEGDGLLLVPIRGRRLATVVTVFVQAVFERFDPCREGLYL
jgi:hypothetical protein